MARKIYEYNGMIGLPTIAKAYGMKQVTLSYRVRTMGMSIEEAVHTPVAPRGEKLPCREKIKENVEKIVATSLTPLWKLALGVVGE
ncbi:hypothetical protein [Vibrio natriegens]|uniref:HTH psq-type domain-containing protein n=1 Tax=Vibrio natriegens NBRC 15636 = ATCC 14048 = DSM 759 TaxID=1219067 RepID=A0AAN0Y2I7_VIBNA|nr:hypothetical protein [Vibrio natriegens]ALR15235.1 hypothetical protein PN96_04305 [Vibrio natriegens NBRC 15636 = ATCC 14048 = DSM 759]ANQ12898.1 hypothetical protein BA890_08985 [Vibrio natriegens NBRC 15636 = ATCC 14048 = DSM 759]EPM39331.1 hypothetical protein M272_17050 [Vibrio natriegens NBRC 15636 = ATCC 14048 = DSM 759]MDX6027311.1 hypothetical protein [Vibrio natriegens NBRC 15636 = ATCC 14048 = DSM 759]UUI10637.1 hypothetical protein NP431_09090 [Vibrio natriegens]